MSTRRSVRAPCVERDPGQRLAAKRFLTLVAMALFAAWGCDSDTQSPNVDTGFENDTDQSEGGPSHTRLADAGSPLPSESEPTETTAPLESVAASSPESDVPSSTAPVTSDSSNPNTDEPIASAQPSTEPSSQPSTEPSTSSTESGGGAGGATDAGSGVDATGNAGGSTGAPWIEVVQPPTEPVACEVESSEVDTALGEPCIVRALCGADGHGFASCFDTGAGQLDCGCWIDDGTFRQVEVVAPSSPDTPAAPDTCELTLQLCADRTPIAFDGAYDCEAAIDGTVGSSCSKLRRCSREATLPGGLVVSDVIDAGVECSGNDPIDCTCTALDGSTSRISFADVLAPEACDLAYSVCLEGVTPSLQADPTCTVLPPDLDTETRCVRAQQCEQTATLGDATVTLAEYTQGSCGGDGDEWSCNCWDSTRAAYYTHAFEQDSASTCAAAFTQCQTALTTEVAGPTSCQVVEDRRGPEGCWLEYSCSRFAEGELQVERKNNPYVSCHDDGLDDAEWLCQCITSYTSTHAVRVSPTPGELDACALFMPTCQALVDVVDATGGYAAPPFAPSPSAN